MGEEKKEEEKKEEAKEEEKKEEKKEEEPPEIVLKVDMHCEACARKVARALKGFEGVEEVTTDSKASKVVVKGKKADPIKVCERLKKKNGRKVELISPLPKPPEENKEENKDPPKEEEKKDEPSTSGWLKHDSAVKQEVILTLSKLYPYSESCDCSFNADMKVTKQVSNLGHILQGKRWTI
ncbi:hypothetical protein NC651_034698 [Populus alba x Populus x berolinensis]|nr:hypothetical protein NC651_034698 [Populus alba x Populus x berolinensis]